MSKKTTYRVWIEIERYTIDQDTAEEEYEDVIEPLQAGVSFPTVEAAQALADRLGALADTVCT